MADLEPIGTDLWRFEKKKVLLMLIICNTISDCEEQKSCILVSSAIVTDMWKTIYCLLSAVALLGLEQYGSWSRFKILGQECGNNYFVLNAFNLHISFHELTSVKKTGL